jgi:hypothetical protein
MEFVLEVSLRTYDPQLNTYSFLDRQHNTKVLLYMSPVDQFMYLHGHSTRACCHGWGEDADSLQNINKKHVVTLVTTATITGPTMRRPS